MVAHWLPRRPRRSRSSGDSTTRWPRSTKALFSGVIDLALVRRLPNASVEILDVELRAGGGRVRLSIATPPPPSPVILIPTCEVADDLGTQFDGRVSAIDDLPDLVHWEVVFAPGLPSRAMVLRISVGLTISDGGRARPTVAAAGHSMGRRGPAAVARRVADAMM